MDSSIEIAFQVFGFEPINKYPKLSNLWFSTHILIVVAQITTIYFNMDVFYSLDVVGNINDITKFTSLFSCYFVSLWSSIYYKETFANITTEIKKLEILLMNFRVSPSDLKESVAVGFKKKSFLFLTTVIVVTIQDGLTKLQEPQTLKYISLFGFPLIYLSIKYLHIIFYFNMIEAYFHVLNEQICQLNEFIIYNESLKNKKYNQFLYKKLKLCKNYYTILHNINSYVNECMGFIFLFNIVNFYLHILSEIYWFIFRLFNQDVFGTIKSKSIKFNIIKHIMISIFCLILSGVTIVKHNR